jgi:nitroreductase
MESTASSAERILRVAAQVALTAPSIFNTQPWRWQVDGTSLELWADRSRQLLVADPDGRLLTVSCGVALDHTLTALAVLRGVAQVRRLPDPAQPDLLAEIRLIGEHSPTETEQRAYTAISRRRTDRRGFTAQPVDPRTSTMLVAAAEDRGAHLYVIRDDQVSGLSVAAQRAGVLQLADAAYRQELASWTRSAAPAPSGSARSRQEFSQNGSGVPLETAVAAGARRVPVREFAPYGGSALAPGRHTDAGARYVVVFTDADTPADWLRAGEALSAVLLTATAEGLAAAPISDVTELAATREELRRLLSGIGYPQLAVRIGHAPPGEPPASPRRHLGDVINPS